MGHYRRVAGNHQRWRAAPLEPRRRSMNIDLTAADGHTLSAWRVTPAGDVKGGLVVIQEIFGVNDHIRSVVARFAGEGYDAIAPALFDRVEPGIELGYESDDVQRGRELRGKVADGDALADIEAAIDRLKADGRKVAVVGYCWGGSLAWATATRLAGIDAAICYYGGQVPDMADESPKVPVMLHFGETDASIPLDRVEAFRQKHPDLPLHIYPAGHGFNCEQRGSYDADSAAKALERTLAFLAEHV
jgi:carboxymethylenebutenolidase